MDTGLTIAEKYNEISNNLPTWFYLVVEVNNKPYGLWDPSSNDLVQI